MKNILFALVATLLLVACNSGDSSTTADAPPEAPAANAAPAAAPPAADAAPADAAPEDAAPADAAPADAAPSDAAAAPADGTAATHADSHDHADGAACTCEQGKGGETVWCDKCSSGWVAGAKMADKEAYLAAAAKPADEGAATAQ